MVESIRGCGYRQIGGIYLTGFGIPHECDRKMVFIDGTCEHGLDLYIQHFRGIRRFSFEKYVNGKTHLEIDGSCECPSDCPICYPSTEREIPDYLMFVGNQFYTPKSFVAEAIDLGASKRIPAIPNDLVIGKSRIFLAMTNIYQVLNSEGKIRRRNGIFYMYTVHRAEIIVSNEDYQDVEKMDILREKGLTPIPVPNEEKHNKKGRTLKIEKPETYKELEGFFE